MKGDPHIKTWGGRWMDYQGECDLVFLHAPDFRNGTGLEIHVRTSIRYWYSYIESAALKIGNDILEVDSFGQYAFNGIDGAHSEELSLPELAGFPVQKRQPHSKKTIFEQKIVHFYISH